MQGVIQYSDHLQRYPLDWTLGASAHGPFRMRLLSGFLVGRLALEVVATWVVCEQPEMLPVTWPEPWRAAFSPLVIFDPSGRLAAYGGQPVTLVGGMVTAGGRRKFEAHHVK